MKTSDIQAVKETHAIVSPEDCPDAYSYSRLSTKRQEKGDGLRRQLERSRRYAAEHRLRLQEKSFEDLGVSAYDGSNASKGALGAFIRAVESGTIRRGSYLLVENLDRISRAELFEAIALLDKLVKLGIRVVTLIDGRVLDEETIKDQTTLFFAVMVFIRANEESATKSDRVKKAHQRKRDTKSSFAFGQGPGWLRPNASKTGWEVIPEKAQSVVKVFELVASGLGSTAIARIANREGWPVPGKAEDWHKTLPHKFVHNRRVLGDLSRQSRTGKSVGKLESVGLSTIPRLFLWNSSTLHRLRQHGAVTSPRGGMSAITTYFKDSCAAGIAARPWRAKLRRAGATALDTLCTCALTATVVCTFFAWLVDAWITLCMVCSCVIRIFV